MNIDCVEKATKIGLWLDRCYRALIVDVDIIRVKPDSDLPRSILVILEHSELMQLCFVLFVRGCDEGAATRSRNDARRQGIQLIVGGNSVDDGEPPVGVI